MDSHKAFQFIMIIGFFLVLVTIVLALNSKKRIAKYCPAIIATVMAIVFCIIISLTMHGSYIGIVYVVVLICTAPVVSLSLLLAVIFDVINFMKKRKAEGREDQKQ